MRERVFEALLWDIDLGEPENVVYVGQDGNPLRRNEP